MPPTAAEIADMEKRDSAASGMWFTGPASFTAQAARDRRALLQLFKPRQVSAQNLIEGLRTLSEHDRHKFLMELHAAFCRNCGSDRGNRCYCTRDD